MAVSYYSTTGKRRAPESESDRFRPHPEGPHLTRILKDRAVRTLQFLKDVETFYQGGQTDRALNLILHTDSLPLILELAKTTVNSFRISHAIFFQRGSEEFYNNLVNGKQESEPSAPAAEPWKKARLDWSDSWERVPSTGLRGKAPTSSSPQETAETSRSAYRASSSASKKNRSRSPSRSGTLSPERSKSGSALETATRTSQVQARVRAPPLNSRHRSPPRATATPTERSGSRPVNKDSKSSRRGHRERSSDSDSAASTHTRSRHGRAGTDAESSDNESEPSCGRGGADTEPEEE